MRDAVKPAFIQITESWEGPASINWMFPDVLGLVSTGMGLLLDPVGMAVILPWRRPDGSLASRDEIVADFYNVKNFPDAARLGHRSVKGIAKLRCNPEDIHARVLDKAHQNEVILRKRFPEWDDFPADAQLALHSWAWGVGPGAPYPKMSAALERRDFRAAAEQIRMVANGVELNGLKPRNAANRTLLLNAAFVEDHGLDPERLWWPRSLETDPLGPEDDTQPNATPSARPDPIRAQTITRFDEALEADRERYRRERDQDGGDPPPEAA